MKRSSHTVRSSLAGLVAAAVLGVTPIAFSQESFAQENAQEQERPSPEERAEKRRARMESHVRERLSPKLGLDAAQEEQLVRAFQETMGERKDAMRALKAERAALAALVEKGAGEAEIDAQLQRLEAAREKLPKRGALLDKTAGFLTAEQQAKLALATPDGKHGKKHHKKYGKRFGKKGERARAPDAR